MARSSRGAVLPFFLGSLSLSLWVSLGPLAVFVVVSTVRHQFATLFGLVFSLSRASVLRKEAEAGAGAPAEEQGAGYPKEDATAYARPQSQKRARAQSQLISARELLCATRRNLHLQHLITKKKNYIHIYNTNKLKKQI